MHQATPPKPPRWYAVAWALGLTLLLIVGAYFVGVRVQLDPSSAYDRAYLRWQASTISDYTIAVDVQAPFTTAGVYVITVQANEITDVTLHNPAVYAYGTGNVGYSMSPDLGTPYTVLGLFTEAEQLVRGLPRPYLHLRGASWVRYNAAGYVQEFHYNRCGMIGLLEECVVHYRVLSLQEF